MGVITTVGIDLGTTNSAMAYVDLDGDVKIVESSAGGLITPSVVTYRDDEWIVGQPAKSQAVSNPENTVLEIKRDMGLDTQKVINGKNYKPEEISAKILMRLREDFKMKFGYEPKNVVVSVPAYFTSVERDATKNAAFLAGWEKDEIRLVNEPNAAAYSYGLENKIDKAKILIFDFEEGSFDVTILGKEHDIFNAITNGGKRLLGGKDFDERIIDYVVKEFKKKYDIDLSDKNREDYLSTMQRLKDEAERTLNMLTDTSHVLISIPYIIPEKKLNVYEELTREKFNEISKDLLEDIKNIIKKTLEDAKINTKDIDKIVMVGGSSRMPAVNDIIEEIFPGKEILLHDPDLAIAKGAAIYANIMFGQDKIKKNLTKGEINMSITMVGIDLGTTNSAMAYVDLDGDVKIVESSAGGLITPSVVTYRDDEWIVGQPAKSQAVSNPENTVLEIKRDMGLDTQKVINGKNYKPEEISAKILMRLREDFKMKFGYDVHGVVISVPAYFTSVERDATKNAAFLAGWEKDEIRLVNEPNAAAYAYGLENNTDKAKILIFDLGGGTFDVTVLDITDNTFNVMTNGGKRLLGGKDFDDRIINYVIKEFKKKYDIDLSDKNIEDYLSIKQRLKDEAERGKITLSNASSAIISVPYIIPEKKLNVYEELTREKFNDISKDLLEDIKNITKKTLEDAKINTNDIDKIVMVGGSSRILIIKNIIEEIFPGKDIVLHDPDLAIAKGAAIFARLKFEPESDEDKDIKQELVGILGAGITRASHTLGTDVVYKGEVGIFSPIIKKDSFLPTVGTEIYHTVNDNQTNMDVKVYEGDDRIAEKNTYWGKVVVSDIPPKPRSKELVEVTFEMSSEQIIHVRTKVLSTGKINEQDVHKISDRELTAMKIKAENESLR